MLAYIGRRFGYMVLMMALVSVASFIIMKLPPGDYLTSYIQRLEMKGQRLDRSEIEALRRLYGLDLPPTQQYLKWMSGVVRGDFGRALQRGRAVSELIGERLPLTLVVNLTTLLFTYIVAIAIGIYSATRQYSIADYVFTTVGFIGMCVPQFLLAMILMVLLHTFFGISVGGLFSPEYAMAPWSWGKVLDLLIHLPVPIIVIGMAGTAGIIRVLRGSLLDELRKQYVITARTKGLSERKLLFKYCLLYTSPSPRDGLLSRMPSSA